MKKENIIAKKGFTLIELLVVVMIIGILTSIALPQYTKSVRRAEMSEGLIQGKSIYDAAVRYKSSTGNAPNSFDVLDVNFIGTDITGNSFNDGNFTYTLTSNDVLAQNNKDNYAIRFVYPIQNDNGVFAPIACCPSTNYVCNNVGVPSNSTGMPANCTEIK